MGLHQFIEKVLSRWQRLPAPVNDANELGRWGEEVAVWFLKRHGFRILRRNFRPRRNCEIDIVARDKKERMLCFVEVKTRSNVEYGRPAMAVDEAKRRRIIRGARLWLRALNCPEVSYRFDIVEVIVRGGEEQPEVNHLRGAFRIKDDVFR
ncbi:MAG: YraN family protein [Chthoniobacterales bacterium]|nr:YraN family protein [Chthoniobacterales bacterium]